MKNEPTSVERMASQISRIFMGHDGVVLQKNIEWAFTLKAEYERIYEENRHIKFDQTAAKFKRDHVPAWLRDSMYRADLMVQVVLDHHKATCDARNTRIAMKAEKEGIDYISKSTSDKNYTDGWNCELMASVMIDGEYTEKKISLKTVWAGGYNIQCLHTRTNVRIK